MRSLAYGSGRGVYQIEMRWLVAAAGLERGPVMFEDHHTFQEVGIIHQVSGPIAGP